jgi:hypothetical protein
MGTRRSFPWGKVAGLNDWGSIPGGGWDIFSSPPVLGHPQPTSLLGGYQSGQGMKQISSPSAKVKNAWSYTSTPQYILKAWCLIDGYILHGIALSEAQGQLHRHYW